MSSTEADVACGARWAEMRDDVLGGRSVAVYQGVKGVEYLPEDPAARGLSPCRGVAAHRLMLRTIARIAFIEVLQNPS